MCSFQRTTGVSSPAGDSPQIVKTGNLLPMVGVTGLEPVTPRLSSACSNQLSYTPRQAAARYHGLSPEIPLPKAGGAEETRTPDL